MSKSKRYYYTYTEYYCAGMVSRSICDQLGLETSGMKTGSAWGSTPKKARKNALRHGNSTIVGNIALEYVDGGSQLYKDGELIRSW